MMAINFSSDKFDNKTLVTKYFYDNIINLMYASYVTHHSLVAEEIDEYELDFCHQKVRENQKFVPVFPHNMLSFDFFFVIKGIRLCVWRTKQLGIRGNNLTNINFANTGNQVKFIDTVKFYQQSLASLAETTTNEKQEIRDGCEKFIKRHNYYSGVYKNISNKGKDCILSYFWREKALFHTSW